MTKKKWEKILAEQIPQLVRYAKALTRNSELVEDLLQDCLERAWQKRDLWDSRRHIRPWLFSIMHNVFINQQKRLSLHCNNKSVMLVEVEQANLSSIDTHSELLELRDFETAFDKLKPIEREIILLAGLEGLSYKEIATITNCPVGTVMSKLSRAREKLRRLMNTEETDNVVQLR